MKTKWIGILTCAALLLGAGNASAAFMSITPISDDGSTASFQVLWNPDGFRGTAAFFDGFAGADMFITLTGATLTGGSSATCVGCAFGLGGTSAGIQAGQVINAGGANFAGGLDVLNDTPLLMADVVLNYSGAGDLVIAGPVALGFVNGIGSPIPITNGQADGDILGTIGATAPEPGALVLLGMTLAGLAFARRRV